MPMGEMSAYPFAYLNPAVTHKYEMFNLYTSCHMDKNTAGAADALRNLTDESTLQME
jgi:hypothetical protein